MQSQTLNVADELHRNQDSKQALVGLWFIKGTICMHTFFANKLQAKLAKLTKLTFTIWSTAIELTAFGAILHI